MRIYEYGNKVKLFFCVASKTGFQCDAVKESCVFNVTNNILFVDVCVWPLQTI